MSAKTDNFINVIAPIAVELYNNNEDWVLPSVMIAQAALESGWDASGAHSLFGIKGAGVESKTQEYINGNYVEVIDSFRTYPDITSACIDYWDLITKNPRYAKVKNNPDYKAAVDGLIHTTDGLAYATSPTYIEKVISIIEDFNLTRFDVRGEYSVPTAQTSNNDIDIEAYAMRTIRGDFGNGADRINNFRKLGFSDITINHIQSCVNEILAPVEEATPQTKEFKIGAHICIKAGAKDLNSGKCFGDWVYESNYDYVIMELQDRGVVFGRDGIITGVVSYDDIIL